ncbi:MAG TPA: hypothetical protein VFZ16_01120 [Hyphomicrobiaceae bacterium]|nr:hypothetical protein [Hyphomicrobiaceae bacterium]
MDGVIERLETLSRTLSEAFRQAGDTRRRGAVLLACEIAVAEAGLVGKAVDKALETLRQGGSDAAVCLAIEGLSDCFDDAYFGLLNDEGVGTSTPEALVQFRKARAAAALAFALSPAPDAPAEALYEALSATDNHAEVIKAIVSSLG